MSSRTYLSIGDVLTLLREEFPDVTISKIRFLESQGLVNPERSPSGYRKFFEHDVERLRWVLRQQREHFLPLKVIRDRLADGDLDDAPQRGVNGKPAEPAGPTSHAADSIGTAVDEQPTKADEEAMARILADASRRAALMPETAQVRRSLQVVGEGAARKWQLRRERRHATRAPTPRRPGPGQHTSRTPARRPLPPRPSPTMPRRAPERRGRLVHPHLLRLRPAPLRPRAPAVPRRRPQPRTAWPQGQA